jgi:mono/diheme cytochrome c family protein
MAIGGNAARRTNPVPGGPDVLTQARAHWADHCATCHGNDGGGQTEMGRHLYPPAPDMRTRDTQHMTDGELFYIIQNGVRLTGMPAWGSEHGGEEDSWKLVRFIRHLPALSAGELLEMEKLNPKSPDEFREEQEEHQFLNGKSH